MPASVMHAIREVARGGTYLDRQVSRAWSAPYVSGTGPAKDPLSARERQVLQLIAEGKKTARSPRPLRQRSRRGVRIARGS
jgi:DNA-binding NarL/FixJ family response regulator